MALADQAGLQSVKELEVALNAALDRFHAELLPQVDGILKDRLEQVRGILNTEVGAVIGAVGAIVDAATKITDKLAAAVEKAEALAARIDGATLKLGPPAA